ncbi:MAG: GNAT family N-acetyltransferase [Haloarculaceae archaeon]
MRPVVLGWPPGPRLRLDHRRFAYAGKFVMSSTGKAVVLGAPTEEGRNGTDTLGDALLDEADRERLARDDGAGRSLDATVLCAVAFSDDRTDPDTLWVRYVTVRTDRQGEGLGPALLAFVRDRAAERGYARVRIGVNNPFSYEAAYRAGFGWTGEETGLAELVCEWPAPDGRSAERYRGGLDRFRDPEHERSEGERSFLAERADADPPTVVDARTPRD